jgi:predicted nucleic acid-binding protein
VPALWFYEIGNGLLMAFRRKRIALDQIEGYLVRLKALPINIAQQTSTEVLGLLFIAHAHGLTNYDAAYLSLAIRFNLPPATTDIALRHAAAKAGVEILHAG